MAIINAVIDERKTRPVKRSTKKETFFSNNTSALTIELDTRVNTIPERITEPLVGVAAALEDMADTLLDEDEDEDSNEVEALDETHMHPQRASSSNVRQTTGAEDAFQSYLRDIRGDRKSTRLNSSHSEISRMPSSA